MRDDFSDRYLDVLQNIESSIVEYYGKHPSMTDHAVERVLENLTRVYSAEAKQHQATPPRLTVDDQGLYDAIKAMCEWRLGRSTDQALDEKISPKTVDEIIACLKRLRRSVKFWTKEGGMRGYLDYVEGFFES